MPGLHVLIVKPSSLGDVIHTLPVARLLKQQHPDCHLAWLVNDNLAALLQCCREVDERLLFHRREWGRIRGWPGFLGLLAQLRRRRFDLVLDFQGLLRSGLCTLAARAPRKVGFADAREGARFCYTELADPPAAVVHAAERNLFLANQALGTQAPLAFPTLDPGPAAAARAAQLLAAAGVPEDAPLIAVAPVARWVSKTWPPEFFAAVLAPVLTARPEAHVWLAGVAADGPAADRIAAGQPRIHSLAGQTDIADMVALLRRSRVLLAGDSGPMHLGVAVGVPTLALFGPTIPRRTGPIGPAHRVFASRAPCAPCLQRVCPLPRQLCLDDAFAPADVAAALLERLA